MKIIQLVLLFYTFFISSVVLSAEKTLTQAETKTLFSNKTFDGKNIRKGKKFRIFTSAEGVQTVKYANGRTKKGTWNVDAKGRHCVKIKRRDGVKRKCRKIVSIGGGVYHKINRFGKHSHTFKNFVDGNKL